jgi:opacity protein-like surface antigen
MNKLLTAFAVSAVALAGYSVNAASHVKQGWNTTVTAGVAQNKMKVKNIVATARNTSKKSVAANLGLRLGHTWAIKEKYFAGINLLAGYNFADTKFAEIPGDAAINYKPRFNFGLGLIGGTCVSETVNTYLALNFLREQSRIIAKDFVTGTKDTTKFHAYTLTPLLGVSGRLADKMSWLAEAGYKFELPKGGLKKTELKEDVKGPKGFVANVGVTYHF